MKTKILFVLLAAFASLLSVGCGNNLSVNPISVSSSDEATVAITIDQAQLGSLGKTAVSSTPTFMVMGYSPAVNGITEDTIPISGTGPIQRSVSGFKKGQAYSVYCRTENNEYKYWLNAGSVSFTVGDVDTFSVSMTLNACASRIKVKVPIKGTPVQSSAFSLSVVWTTTYSGPPVKDSSKVVFAVGSLDTGLVEGVMPINQAVGSQTSYTVKVSIFLTDGGFYQGEGSVNLSPSANATLSIPLTKFGGGGSLAKMVITLNPLGQLDVSVSFS